MLGYIEGLSAGPELEKQICHEKICPPEYFCPRTNNLTYLLKFFVRCCKCLSYQIKMADSNRTNLEESIKLTNNTYANSKNAVS